MAFTEVDKDSHLVFISFSFGFSLSACKTRQKGLSFFPSFYNEVTVLTFCPTMEVMNRGGESETKVLNLTVKCP